MLQKETLKFLQQLKKNNDRSWFEAHRKNYDAAKSDFIELVQNVLTSHGKKDADIAILQPKECVFRINRDVRFSKNKSPYKTNMGASFNRGGKKSIYAGYYLHVEPGGHSFVGGGLWMPEPAHIKSIRQEIDYCFDDFKKIVEAKKFKKFYGEFERTKETALSREPKGFEKDNPAINYIKLKTWVVTAYLKDEELLQKDLIKKISYAFETLQPLVQFLNRSMED
ncbi:MAG: hypothetical protein JWN76_3750 [Chitinophagaceae bacterium]|nr:hypothetical protein [Chitinophagaceae bacterium]